MDNMNQKGMTNLGYLVMILIVLAGVFSSAQILPFYYSYYELRGEMDAKAVLGKELSDTRITESVNQVIKKLGVPADINDLKINRFDDKIVISLEYEEVFYVDFGGGYDFDIWVFHFNPKVERPI